MCCTTEMKANVVRHNIEMNSIKTKIKPLID